MTRTLPKLIEKAKQEHIASYLGIYCHLPLKQLPTLNWLCYCGKCIDKTIGKHNNCKKGWKIEMKKLSSKIKLLFTLLIFLFVLNGCGNNSKITYNYLTAEESADVLGGVDYYYDSLGQKMLEFLCQKKGATAEEYREYSMKQTMDYTEAEKEVLDKSMARIMNIIEENGYKLPKNSNISFAKTTMEEGLGAAGYTHGTTVFLGQDFIDLITNHADVESVNEYCDEVVAHEMFHCLTRNNPDFRKAMYSIINFTVGDSDYDIPKEIKNEMVRNPDVRNHDSYATFTINGEKKDCYLVFLTDNTFEKTGDVFLMACIPDLLI